MTTTPSTVQRDNYLHSRPREQRALRASRPGDSSANSPNTATSHTQGADTPCGLDDRWDIMTPNHQEMLTRLNTIVRRLAVVSQSLATEIEQSVSVEMAAEKLRSVGYELVSLAGQLTVLGVDVARSAEDGAGRSDDGAK